MQSSIANDRFNFKYCHPQKTLKEAFKIAEQLDEEVK